MHVSVPVALPPAERIEAIVREEVAKAVASQMRWLSNRQCADYLGWGLRTWERRKKTLGVPVSEIDGLQRYLRDDLDALLLAHSSAPASSVIEFPSQRLRAA